MAFNFGAFLGGASDNLVDMIKTKEAQLYKEEQDEKETKRRARVAAATQRRADEKEAKELAEGLSLFYSADQVQDIMSKGKTAGKYAISYAENMANKGYDASAGYAMPKTSIQSEFAFDVDDPRGSQIDPQMAEIETGRVQEMTEEAEAQPFVSRFTQPPKDAEMTKAKTFEARLVELDFQRTNAPTEAQREEFNSTYTETLNAYQKFKAQLADKGTDTSKITLSNADRSRYVNNALDRAFQNVSWAERDISGKLKLSVTGNEANSFDLRKKAVVDLRELAAQYNDPAFDTLINGVERGYKADVETKKQIVYRAHLGAQRAATDNDASIDSYDASTARAFKALPENGRTKKQLTEQAQQGFYKQNDVVAYTDAEGNMKLALISDGGIFY